LDRELCILHSRLEQCGEEKSSRSPSPSRNKPRFFKQVKEGGKHIQNKQINKNIRGWDTMRRGWNEQFSILL
jgi:hypothetical protein